MALTWNDIQTAEANGISEGTFKKRIFDGWDKEEAMTKPVQKKRFPQYRELCKRNGVSQMLFAMRVRNGIDPLEAASTPPAPPNMRGAGRKQA